MYSIEESTCDIVGTLDFSAPPSYLAPAAVYPLPSLRDAPVE